MTLTDEAEMRNEEIPSFKFPHIVSEMCGGSAGEEMDLMQFLIFPVSRDGKRSSGDLWKCKFFRSILSLPNGFSKWTTETVLAPIYKRKTLRERERERVKRATSYHSCEHV